MTTFVAVYRGDTVAAARLIAVSADPSIVADIVTRLLAEVQDLHEDPAVAAVDDGRRRALRAIRREVALCPR